MRASDTWPPGGSGPKRRATSSREATDLLASDIAGELDFSKFRAAAGEPTIVDAPARFYRFDSVRAWHFDFAWLERKIAAEVEPASTIVLTMKNYRDSLAKFNTAVLAGWRVLRFTPDDVKSGRALETLRRALSPHIIQEKNADAIQPGRTEDGATQFPLSVDR